MAAPVPLSRDHLVSALTSATPKAEKLQKTSVEAPTWFGNEKAFGCGEGGNNQQVIRWKAKYLACAEFPQR